MHQAHMEQADISRLNAIFQMAFSDNPNESQLALAMIRRQLAAHGMQVGDILITPRSGSHAEELMGLVKQQQATIERLRSFKLRTLSGQRQPPRRRKAGAEVLIPTEGMEEILHVLAPDARRRARVIGELLQVSRRTASDLLRKGFSKSQAACLHAAAIRDRQTAARSGETIG